MGKRQGALENLGMTTRLPDPAFWRGKRVFVTGHSGFKGAWLSLLLERLGAETMGYSLRPNTRPSLCELIRLNGSQVHDWLDIRDSSVLMDRIASFRPDIILHLAAQPLVRRSHREPLETFTTNVNGTLQVLEAARACSSARAFISGVTRKVTWGERSALPVSEGRPARRSRCSWARATTSST